MKHNNIQNLRFYYVFAMFHMKQYNFHLPYPISLLIPSLLNHNDSCGFEVTVSHETFHQK